VFGDQSVAAEPIAGIWSPKLGGSGDALAAVWNADGVEAPIRLADVLGGLSVVSDMGYGLPPETAMRACLVGTGLARAMDLSEEQVGDVFYVSLLLHVGCIAFSHETAVLFGDDLAVNRAAIRTNFTDVRQVFTVLIPGMTREMQAGNRLKSAATMTAKGRSFGMAHDLASCEVARAVARRLGLADAVGAGLYDVHEWWNGRGAKGLRGEEIARPARMARVATEAAILAGFGGSEVVVGGLRRRAGKTLDPEVVDRFASGAETLLAELAVGDPRARLVEVEPAVAEISELDLVHIAAAFGDLVDLKTPFTHGHSGGVADLAVAAAERARLDPLAIRQLHVAALLHDVGRAGVSNAVWEKPGPLTTAEWEQARIHAYLSERVMATSAALAPMAFIAGGHHERLDGSGYHRGCRGPELAPPARVLAAADAFHAMTEVRPHRAAMGREQAAETLAREAHAGRLDADAVAAVLESAGRPAVRRRHDLRPGGLTDREIEVIRLVAAGCTNPDIGRRLGISRRTAEHHVQHIYTKIGVSTRAAATLFALEHDLLADR
jgi:HD-GYP domain-containing protein (c-di-GMP phosphodiesterase class II)